MSDNFFNAIDIEFGFCKSPECKAVHIHLLDAGGTPRAQAVIACDNVEQFITDMRQVRDMLIERDRTGSRVRH